MVNKLDRIILTLVFSLTSDQDFNDFLDKEKSSPCLPQGANAFNFSFELIYIVPLWEHTAWFASWNDISLHKWTLTFLKFVFHYIACLGHLRSYSFQNAPLFWSFQIIAVLVMIWSNLVPRFFSAFNMRVFRESREDPGEEIRSGPASCKRKA